MSIINQAIEAVMDMIDELNLFAKITRGALGTKTGICCEISPTTPSEVYIDKNRLIPVDLTINGKHENLQTLTEAMNKIHETLPMKKSYTSGNGWEIVDIESRMFPEVIGREASNIWIMASNLIVKVGTSDPVEEPEQTPAKRRGIK